LNLLEQLQSSNKSCLTSQDVLACRHGTSQRQARDDLPSSTGNRSGLPRSPLRGTAPARSADSSV